MLLHIQRLAAEPLTLVDSESVKDVQKALLSVTRGATVYLPLQGVIDIEKETERLEKAMEDLAKDIERTRSRLSQEDFLSRAPQEIVEAQRKRFEDASAKLETLKARVEMLKRMR